MAFLAFKKKHFLNKKGEKEHPAVYLAQGNRTCIASKKMGRKTMPKAFEIPELVFETEGKDSCCECIECLVWEKVEERKERKVAILEVRCSLCCWEVV